MRERTIGWRRKDEHRANSGQQQKNSPKTGASPHADGIGQKGVDRRLLTLANRGRRRSVIDGILEVNFKQKRWVVDLWHGHKMMRIATKEGIVREAATLASCSQVSMWRKPRHDVVQEQLGRTEML